MVSEAQQSKSSFSSGDNSTISFSAKNCDCVMPIPAHIASSVEIDGFVFLRNTLAIVDSDNPASFDNRYSDQPRALMSIFSFSCTLTYSIQNCKCKCFNGNTMGWKQGEQRQAAGRYIFFQPFGHLENGTYGIAGAKTIQQRYRARRQNDSLRGWTSCTNDQRESPCKLDWHSGRIDVYGEQ